MKLIIDWVEIIVGCLIGWWIFQKYPVGCLIYVPVAIWIGLFFDSFFCGTIAIYFFQTFLANYTGHTEIATFGHYFIPFILLKEGVRFIAWLIASWESVKDPDCYLFRGLFDVHPPPAYPLHKTNIEELDDIEMENLVKRIPKMSNIEIEKFNKHFGTGWNFEKSLQD